MQVTGQTKDGTVHRFINGEWELPIVVPASVHERALRRVNKLREVGITHGKKKACWKT